MADISLASHSLALLLACSSNHPTRQTVTHLLTRPLTRALILTHTLSLTRLPAHALIVTHTRYDSRGPQVSPRVRALFEKHGVKYDTRDYLDAVAVTFKNLDQVGKDAWYG